MCVDLLRFVLVQRNESVQDIVACGSVIGTTLSRIRFLMISAVASELVELAFIIWEIVLHWGNGQFLLESVDLV